MRYGPRRYPAESAARRCERIPDDAGACVARQQRIDVGAQRADPAAGLDQIDATLIGRTLQRRVEDSGDERQRSGVHGVSWLCSQARAARHSRSTVLGAMSSTQAVSSSDSPPK